MALNRSRAYPKSAYSPYHPFLHRAKFNAPSTFDVNGLIYLLSADIKNMARIYRTVMARYKLKGHEDIKRLIAIGTYDYNIYRDSY